MDSRLINSVNQFPLEIKMNTYKIINVTAAAVFNMTDEELMDGRKINMDSDLDSGDWEPICSMVRVDGHIVINGMVMVNGMDTMVEIMLVSGDDELDGEIALGNVAKGDYVKLITITNGVKKVGTKVYKRGVYLRGSKRYELIDCEDIGRTVLKSGMCRVIIGFTY